VQDLGEKARLYAEHTIPEYWVVDIPAEQVHVHHTPLGGRYESIQSFGESDSIRPRCLADARLCLSELFDLDS
jgi:Uma2 family endonuclease